VWKRGATLNLDGFSKELIYILSDPKRMSSSTDTIWTNSGRNSVDEGISRTKRKSVEIRYLEKKDRVRRRLFQQLTPLDLEILHRDLELEAKRLEQSFWEKYSIIEPPQW
jgi:hypothetical protein